MRSPCYSAYLLLLNYASKKKNLVSVVLCTHYPPYKTNDPDLWNCKAGNGCIALHYSVHFLRISSFISFTYESEGIGARSVRPPPRFDVCPTRSRKHGHRTRGHIIVCHWSYPLNHIRSYMVEWVRPVAYNDMAPSSTPMFSGAGRADVKTGWWRDRSCTDALTFIRK